MNGTRLLSMMRRGGAWTIAIALVGLLVAVNVRGAVASQATLAPAGEEYFVVTDFEGFFYAAEYPGEAPLVKVGTHVEPQMIVGYIQGMQKRPVVAGVRGAVTEVMVQDMQTVSAGQPLFRIELDP